MSEYPLQRDVLPINHDPSCPWDRTHEMVKLALNRCKIGEYVSMIELQIVQNRGPRPVVDEFGALVKEGGVVFVRLDDKKLRGA